MPKRTNSKIRVVADNTPSTEAIATLTQTFMSQCREMNKPVSELKKSA